MARCLATLLRARPWCVALLALGVAACSDSGTRPDGAGGNAGGGAGGAPVGGTGGTGGGLPGSFKGRVIELEQAMRRSDLVFEGEVIGVAYANALDSGVGDSHLGEDGKTHGLPHTFVTYRLDEVFTNNHGDETVTLRFAGGVDTESGPDYDILSIAQHPHFDLGDRDILFVKGNEHALCPLDRCSNGRYRVLPGSNGPEGTLYTELGQEVRLRVESAEEAHLFAIGHHPVEALLVSSFTMPNAEIVTLEAISGEESGEDDPVLGASSSTGLKHSFGPTEEGEPPLPNEAESDVGVLLAPDDLRHLIRAFVEAHPDFAWAPIASSDPDEAFSLGPILADVAPLSDGLDPKPPVREPDAIDTMETDAIDALIEAAECHDETPGEGCDVAPSQELIDEIRGRRETITGITERPNRRTRIADEEDMWTDENEGGR